jgi:glycosyltransferase involved in cell wall biosynthesis
VSISCIIPTLNEEKNIKLFLDSYLIQSKKFDELIIVDSNSKDSTIKVINSYNIPELNLIICNKKGTSVARNIGLKQSTSDKVIFMDADWSFLHPYTVSQLYKYPANTYIIVRNDYPSTFKGFRKFIYLKDKDVSLKIVDRKTCPIWDEELGYGEDKDFSNKFHKIGFDLYEVDDTIVGLSRANGDMSLEKYVKRYKWYGRTMIPFLKKNFTWKQLVGYVGYVCPLLWGIPFVRGFINGFLNHDKGIEVIPGMILIELIAAYGIMLGTIDYLLNKKELGRDL